MASTVFKRDEVIMLLGAGASVEAGIPDSNEMVRRVEGLIQTHDGWKRHQGLYNYIRSSIYYADGIDGVFGDSVQFNIERLVNVLEELQRKERHTLYPFVGAWNPKLVEVAGVDFENVETLRTAIVQILRDEWVVLPRRESASYYSGLVRFQEEFEHPLRVFSLNYDLCVEETCGRESVQRGFADDRAWDWRLFNETSGEPIPLLLYKLHGSVDWHTNNYGMVTYSDSTSSIRSEDVALIFGTSYKLQYVDPFLFLAYELRRWTLDAARVIVCIGYGFNDEHINGILEQSLRQDQTRRLLAIIGPANMQTEADRRKHISEILHVEYQQIKTRALGAKEFLEECLTIEELSSLFPSELGLMRELPPSAD